MLSPAHLLRAAACAVPVLFGAGCTMTGTSHTRVVDRHDRYDGHDYDRDRYASNDRERYDRDRPPPHAPDSRDYPQSDPGRSGGPPEHAQGKAKGHDKDKHADSPGPGNGPPSWAPAHGRRAKFQYRYYPDTEVYYEPTRKTYFWMDGGSWQMGVRLPDHFHLGGSVSIEMDADRPYRYHSEVRQRYGHH